VSRSRSTEELVARLAEGLDPVRPVAPVSLQVLAVGGICVATAAALAVWLGLHPLSVLERGRISATIAAMLALLGSSGLTLGLACRIPGRERLAWGAAAVLAAGASILGTVLLALPDAPVDPFAESASCILRSILLAAPSGLLALALALRGAQWRPWITGLALSTGAASVGGLLVHLSCPSPDAWHWLLAHALAPASAGLLLGTLAAWALEGIGRRSESAAARGVGA